MLPIVLERVMQNGLPRRRHWIEGLRYVPGLPRSMGQDEWVLGFTYLPGTVYFKDSMGQASANQNVSSAFKQTASSGSQCNCPPAPTVTVYAPAPAPYSPLPAYILH